MIARNFLRKFSW